MLCWRRRLLFWQENQKSAKPRCSVRLRHCVKVGNKTGSVFHDLDPFCKAVNCEQRRYVHHMKQSAQSILEAAWRNLKTWQKKWRQQHWRHDSTQQHYDPKWTQSFDDIAENKFLAKQQMIKQKIEHIFTIKKVDLIESAFWKRLELFLDFCFFLQNIKFLSCTLHTVNDVRKSAKPWSKTKWSKIWNTAIYE